MSEKARGYIYDRVEGLTEHSQEIAGAGDNVANEFDSWSALKLILHSAAVNMYTKVISEHKNDFFYIDALAGAGASKYDENQYFIGSALLAAKAASEPFTKMYFVEGKKEYKEALESRLDYVFSNPHIDVQEPQDYEVIHGDANEEIPKIVDEIWDIATPNPSFNYYCFIDNQGLNVSWDTVESLAPTPHGDLLINYPSSQAIGRNALRDEKSALNEFFGVELNNYDIPEEDVREYLKELYTSRLAGLERPVQESTYVYSGVGSYSYDMIYATRETEGGSEYIEVIKYVKEFIEAFDGADVDDMLDIINGDQDTMESYYPESSDIDDSLPEESDAGNHSLGDFG